jgi:hypothetical protein
MFAKLVDWGVFHALRGPRRNPAVPANDNRRLRAIAAVSPRGKRPLLVCRWRKPARGGALTSAWQTEPAQLSAPEDPATDRSPDPLQRSRRVYRRQAAGGDVVSIAGYSEGCIL